MDFWKENIPQFLYKKQNITSLVIFTAVFALLFINWYQPFGTTSWFKTQYPDLSDFLFFFASCALVLIGLVVMAASRAFLYLYSKKNAIKWWMFTPWLMVEIIVLAASYSGLSYTVIHQMGFFERFGTALKMTTLILLIPYIIAYLYFSYDEKTRLLKKIKEQRDQENSIAAIIAFYDERNEMKLSIKRANLLYLASADNYVSIFYLNNGSVIEYLLRNTMKNVEQSFEGTSVIRCHRSYMVNFDHIAAIKKKKDGISIELDVAEHIEIPVSKSYSNSVTNIFGK
ncbi:MAG: LytTR family transcriptional regulator [Bacteroidales bacterium]|nr:LytTR family transcriptional regulator [Bacteroidales bacterium]